MTKSIHIIILFFFVFIPYLAHSQYQLSGSIIDSDGHSLSGVTVTLVNAENKSINTLTDYIGQFKLVAVPGNYIIKIHPVGFNNYSSEISLTADLALGLIILESQVLKLDEVTISIKQPLVEQKSDRYIFNVGNSATAMGNDGVQVLRKTPGVQVSGNSINLAGKGKVRVMINDRLLTLSGEDLLDFLKSIQSEDIAAIEVITNPPAKYDAQGSSGLINIKLRKSTAENISGNISATYSQATYASANLASGLNYKKNKLSFSTSLSTGDGSVKETADEKIFYADNLRMSKEAVRAYNRYLSGRLSADYELSNNSAIGLEYSGNQSSPDSKDQIKVRYPNASTDQSIGSLTTGNTQSTVNSNNIGAYYLFKIDTLGKNFRVGVDYFVYKTARDRLFISNESETNTNGSVPVETSPFSAVNSGKQNIEIYTSTIDAEFPYKWAKIEWGGKLSFINNLNDIGLQNVTTGSVQSDRFLYKENVSSLYAGAYRKFSKWEARAGLRFEATITEGISASLTQNNKRTYNSFFPSAYLGYSHNDIHKFTLTYGKRINRPSYEALNPFRWYLNVSSYRAGNPFLKPEAINNLEFAHNYQNSLISKLYASRTANWYERITYISSDSPIQAYVYENYATFYTIGISESFSFEISDIWESNNQVMAYYNYSDIQLDVLKARTKGMSGLISTSNSFTLNSAKTIFAEVNYTYQLPAAITQYELGNFQELTLGVKFHLFKKHVHLGVNGSDVFKTNIPNIAGYTNNIRQEYQNYGDLRRLVFSISYKFGSDKLKTNHKNPSNEAETGRAK